MILEQDETRYLLDNSIELTKTDRKWMIVTLDINGFFFDNIPPYFFLMISSCKMCQKLSFENCYISLSLHINEIFIFFSPGQAAWEPMSLDLCQTCNQNTKFCPALSRLPFLIPFGYVTKKQIIPRFTRHLMWQVTIQNIRWLIKYEKKYFAYQFV